MELSENYKKDYIMQDSREVFIKRVEELSQKEGLRDHEIADILGCSRATVNRTRRMYEIPMANLSNRQDKEFMCNYCGVTRFIRRKERRKKRCSECNKHKQSVTKATE